MHSKYIVRDEAAVWTGSVNLTDDSWKFKENNMVQVNSAKLASYYETDFRELWISGDIDSTGLNDAGTLTVEQETAIDVAFSPGEGTTIDTWAANLVSSAKRIYDSTDGGYDPELAQSTAQRNLHSNLP